MKRSRFSDELTVGILRMTDTEETTGGPARYARVKETGGRIGFITALSDCFCEGCNRLRLSATARSTPASVTTRRPTCTPSSGSM